MMSPAEITANVLNTGSIFLAGRNSVHTWWTGIFGCVAFGYVFFEARLYADVTLQIFFIITSILGWIHWRRGLQETELPVRYSKPLTMVAFFFGGGIVAASYGYLLHRFTNAYAPFLDSVVLSFSVLAQFLLMGRRVENWWFWLLVNSIATPLYAVRGLHVTAALYAAYWVNALISLLRWQRLAAAK